MRRRQDRHHRWRPLAHACPRIVPPGLSAAPLFRSQTPRAPSPPRPHPRPPSPSPRLRRPASSCRRRVPQLPLTAPASRALVNVSARAARQVPARALSQAGRRRRSPWDVCVGDLLQTDPQERAKTTTASSDCRPRPTVPDPRSACAHTPKSYARQAPVLGLGRLLDGPSSPPRGGELVRLFPAAVLVESCGVRLDLGVSEQPHRCADGVLLRAVGTRAPQGGANGGAVLASATGSASATGKPQCARRTAHAPAAPSG